MKKNVKPIFVLACSTLFVGAYAAPALGATRTVPSAAFPTIQAAVIASGPGDTINVRDGVYFENVTVPAGKNGLRIIGQSQARTIIDARPNSPIGTGPGFFIQSDNVLIRTLTVRFAKSGGTVDNGDDILCQANGCTFQFITTLSATGFGDSGSGIKIVGNRAIVTDSTFAGNDNVGLLIDGDDARILRNISRNNGQRGYEVNGNRALLESNQAALIEDDGGFHITGDNNTLRLNSATSLDGGGFLISGDNVILDRNKVSGTYSEDCFEVLGNNAQLLSNSAKGCHDEPGSSIDCFHVEGDVATLKLNLAYDCNENGYDVSGYSAVLNDNEGYDEKNTGFLVASDDAKLEGNYNEAAGNDGFNIAGNDLKLYANTGVNSSVDNFDITGDDPIITGNSAIDNGFNGLVVACLTTCGGLRVSGNKASGAECDDDGIDVGVFGTGTGWIVENNETNGNVQHGLIVTGNGGIIRNNRAAGNGSEDEAGIEVDGNANEISGNVAKDNEGDGLLVSGDDNIIRNNTTSGNLLEGLHLDFGDANQILSNSSFANNADGIRNDGTNTILKNNRSFTNRPRAANFPGADCTSDLADGASVATNIANFCADGSNFSTTQSPLLH